MRHTGLLIFILMVLLGYMSLDAKPVLQITDTLGRQYVPVEWEEIDDISIQEQGNKTLMRISGPEKVREVILEESSIINGNTVPLVTITTDEYMEEIPDKINYQTARINIRGFGEFEDFEGEVSIRGRGNSSWKYWDKKPYRLKFDKKQQLCGLNKAKSYVLTANWTDVSLMQNPMAAFLAKMLGLPYTNTFIPVDVIFNGSYRGSYLLTNKPGINAGSVDIDEEKSVMWELDDSYDEDFKFMSPIYNLPVMLKDPDMDAERFEYWKQDFIAMEEAVSRGEVEEWIDVDTYARYRTVYTILYNKEIGHPKSLMLYKTEGGKYQFGPIWDFDVALGYLFDEDLSYTDKEIRYDIWLPKLMTAIEKNKRCQELLTYYFKYFLENEQLLWDYVEELEPQIRNSAIRNNIKWKTRGDWEDNVEKMKSWLHRRIEILKTKYKYAN